MALLRSMETAQPKSPESETFVHRALLQEEQPTQTAAQIQQGLDKVHRGKRVEEADEDEKTGKEKVFLRKKMHEIENNKTDDTFYNDDDWAQYIVTRMTPNASPERDMKYIVDKLPLWAHQALTTGQFPGPQLVDGKLIDVTTMVKVEMERVKDSYSIGKGIAWSGGVGSGAQGARGMASPSTGATVEIPGQWIAQPAASGAGGNGGGSGGDPAGDIAVGYGGGRREDKGKEFTIVNPRNITIPIFTGKALNTNPYLFFNNAIRRLIMAQGADGIHYSLY